MHHSSQFRCDLAFPITTDGARRATTTANESLAMRSEETQEWQVGQRILCVDDSFSSDAVEACDSLPVAGRIYTIRAIRSSHTLAAENGGVAVLLAEILNSRLRYGKEPGFWLCRFKLCS